MELLKNSGFFSSIQMLTEITWDEGQLEITFQSTDKKQYKIFFKHVLDFRCSVENGYIDRFCRFRENLAPSIIDNGLYLVENSEYTAYFQKQACGTIPVDDIKDYLYADRVDTVIEILSGSEPEIFPIDVSFNQKTM